MPIFPEWTKMDYELSGPLAGIESANRDYALKERMALENLFQQAQTRGQDLSNQGMEAKLPYLGDEARLKNVQTQQGIDLQLPQQGLAKTLANDLTYMQGQGDLARGKQQGQLGQQELQNRVTHYDMLMDAYANGGQMGFLETAKKLNIPMQQLQSHFAKGGDPISSMRARRDALVTQMALSPEQVGKERIEEQKGLVDLEKARIASETAKYGYDKRGAGGGSTPKPMSSDQVFAALQLKAASGEQLTEVEMWTLENIMKLKSAGKQAGLTINPNNPEAGLTPRISTPQNLPPQPGATAAPRTGGLTNFSNTKRQVTRDPKTGKLTVQ